MKYLMRTSLFIHSATINHKKEIQSSSHSFQLPYFPNMPRKVVINTGYGGFSLSKEVKQQYLQATKDVKRGEYWHIDTHIERDDPCLIQLIESVGIELAGGVSSQLKIVELPDDVPEDGWTIMEYDGMEWVAEKHRTWH